ncbi:MAG: hypothetical protein F9K44_08500 [Hyphomicrobiaceae bacterium]|nr:MAG: hypothetical protein F9K44_08500 [Hyphomicrobiaceae bacterium]
MTLVPIAGPAIEPVTLEEAKAHLRVDTDPEDTLTQSLITAARVHVEVCLGVALLSQSWLWLFDQWPKVRVAELPLRPVQSIASVKVRDANGNPVTMPASNYLLDGRGNPARLIASGPGGWPASGMAANGIEVELVAGYGSAAADVPRPLRHAILLLVAHWFERREPVEVGEELVTLPDMVGELLQPYRRVRL